jgi:hypothetical protein
MRAKEELRVITEAYDLILWSCHHTSRFPRTHRFVLGDRIERKLYDLLETLINDRPTRQRHAAAEARSLRALAIYLGKLGSPPQGR